MVEERQVREKIQEIAEDIEKDIWATWYAVRGIFNKNVSLEKNVKKMKRRIADSYPDVDPEDVGLEETQEENSEEETSWEAHYRRELFAEGLPESDIDEILEESENVQDIMGKLREMDYEEEAERFPDEVFRGEEEESELSKEERNVLKELADYISYEMPAIPMVEIKGVMRDSDYDLPEQEVEASVKSLHALGYLRRNEERRYSLTDQAGDYINENWPELTEKYTWEEAQEEIPELAEYEPQDEYKGEKYTLDTWREYLKDAKKASENYEKMMAEGEEEELEIPPKREVREEIIGQVRDARKELKSILPAWDIHSQLDEQKIIARVKKGTERIQLGRDTLERIGDWQKKYGMELETWGTSKKDTYVALLAEFKME